MFAVWQCLNRKADEQSDEQPDVQTHTDALSKAQLLETNKAIASSCSSHSLKPLPVQRPKGSYKGFVCVSICVSALEQSWGTVCSNFPFLGSSRKANTSFFLSLSLSSILSLFHNDSFYRSTRSLEMGGPQPKVSSIDLALYVFRVCIVPQILVTRGH